jgi:hypothetical protein
MGTVRYISRVGPSDAVGLPTSTSPLFQAPHTGTVDANVAIVTTTATAMNRRCRPRLWLATFLKAAFLIVDMLLQLSESAEGTRGV